MGMEFNPPYPLPHPDCDHLPGNPTQPNPVSNPVSNPTSNPTSNPVPAPTPTGGGGSNGPDGVPEGCKKLGTESNGVDDAACNQCTQGNPQIWYPCNSNPPRCHGLDCENSPNWTGPKYRSPTQAPIPDGCERLGTENNGVDDAACDQCTQGNPQIWYPCNSNPPRCHG